MEADFACALTFIYIIKISLVAVFLCVRFTFFGSLIIVPSFHSIGSDSMVQRFSTSWDTMLSSPAALLFLTKITVLQL